MDISQTNELIALQKALMFVKFGSEDDEACYLACSPVYGSLLQRITEHLSPYYTKYNGSYGPVYGNIESVPHYLHKVKIHLGHIDNWREIERERKIGIINDLCSPYTISANTAIELLDEQDRLSDQR